MTKDARQDIRYFTPLVFGFIIIMIAILVPPLGAIETSAIYAAGCFLILSGAVIGLDIPALLHEINELKRLKLEEVKNEKEE